MASHEDRGKEQRKSYRCPVAPAQQEAELRFRGRRLPVRLYNESAGGFAACAEQDPGLKPGDLAELLQGTDSVLVRVTHVGKIEPQPGSTVGATVYRIGLDRTPDAPPQKEQGPSRQGRRRRAGNMSWFLPARNSATLSAAVSLLVAVGLAVGLAVLIRRNHPLAQYLYSGHAPPALGAIHDDVALPPKSRLAEVAPELGMSDAQQRQVREAAEALARALADLDAHWQQTDSRDRPKMQARLWEATEKEILRTLKDEDRKRWEPILR
jgi:hypothetical protein